MRYIDGDELEKRLLETANTAEVQALGIYKSIAEIHKMEEVFPFDIVMCEDCKFASRPEGCPINKSMKDNKIEKEYWYCGLAVKK